jgi:hypothetical protein
VPCLRVTTPTTSNERWPPPHAAAFPLPPLLRIWEVQRDLALLAGVGVPAARSRIGPHPAPTLLAEILNMAQNPGFSLPSDRQIRAVQMSTARPAPCDIQNCCAPGCDLTAAEKCGIMKQQTTTRAVSFPGIQRYSKCKATDQGVDLWLRLVGNRAKELKRSSKQSQVGVSAIPRRGESFPVICVLFEHR